MARVGGKIQHALNGGEVKIQRPDGRFYKVDGFCWDPLTGQEILFDFNGCLFHGCLECYPEDIIHPHFGQTLKQRHAFDNAKENRPNFHGLQVCRCVGTSVS